MAKDSGNLSIREQYAEFRRIVNQTFWEESAELRLDGVKKVLECSMVMEREAYLSARRYERSAARKGYALGYCTGSLVTCEGVIPDLRASRTRHGGSRVKTLRRYARRAQRVDELIRRIYLNGVFTHDVGQVLEASVGVGVSAATVSKLARDLDGERGAFHRRRREDIYHYIMLDGVNLQSLECGRGQKRVVLVAVRIRGDGGRELIDFHTADSEGERE